MASIWSFFAFNLVVFTARAITINDCPSFLHRDVTHVRVFRTSCYEFILSLDRGFSDAERDCEHGGGHLVLIKDLETQDFIYNTLKNEFHVSGLIWMGLSDRQTEGHWVWVDGTPVHYSNWNPGTLGLFNVDQDCGTMDVSSSGHWADENCEYILFFPQSHRYICEYPVHITTTTTTTTAVVGGSSCLQCGDYNSTVPCTEEELTTTQSTACGQSGLNYCMTDVYKISADSSLSIYKRCVDEANCLKDFYIPSLQTDYCQHLDTKMPDIIACHLCCHGDACNTGLVPDPTTLYQVNG